MSTEERMTTDDEDAISQRTWRLILEAAARIEEGLKEATRDLERGVNPSETALGDWMPRRFLPRYDSSFAERLSEEARALNIRLIADHTSGGYPGGLLNSVAQEMLLALVLDLANEDATLPDSEELENIRFVCFEDLDFELLYDLSRDGVTDEPAIKAQAGFAHLEFDKWFEPFR